MGLFDSVSSAVNSVAGAVGNVGNTFANPTLMAGPAMWNALGSGGQNALINSAMLGPVGTAISLPGLFGGGGGQPGQNPGGFDMYGRPELAKFESVRNADGSIKDIYKSQNMLNTQALEAGRAEALRDPATQSRWAQLAKTDQASQLANQQTGQLARATSNLAMQGGLRGGARENLARQSLQSGLLGQQAANAGINMQDEQNRQRWLQMQPGAELQAAQYGSNVENQNIGRALGDVTQQRAYDMGKYAEAMRAWAAQQTANAAPQTQDKGFFGNLLGSIF